MSLQDAIQKHLMSESPQTTDTAQNKDVEAAVNEDKSAPPLQKALNTLPADEPLDAIDANSKEAQERSHGRRHERIELEISVTLNGEDTFYVGLTENLSEGGVFVYTSCPWPLGTEVDLSLSLDEHEPFFVPTVIRWIREDKDNGIPAGMGLEFKELNLQDEQKVRAFIFEKGKATEFYDV